MPRLYGTKPELMTPDAVIHYYNENGGGLYRIYLGDSSKNKLRFTGNNEETLINALSIIEENPVNTNIYTIALFEGNGRKEEIKAEINFCFNDNAAVSGVGNQKIEYYLKKLTERDEDDEDDDDAQPVGGYWERVLPPEQMGAVIQQIAGLIISKILPDQTQTIPGNMVAGVDTEHIQILSDLMSKGVTIEHLRKLNAMSIVQLKTLLTML